MESVGGNCLDFVVWKKFDSSIYSHTLVSFEGLNRFATKNCVKQVWAREYITPTRVIEESTTTTNFPFSIRWKDSQPPTMEYGVLLQYYRIKLLDLQRNEVSLIASIWIYKL